MSYTTSNNSPARISGAVIAIIAVVIAVLVLSTLIALSCFLISKSKRAEFFAAARRSRSRSRRGRDNNPSNEHGFPNPDAARNDGEIVLGTRDARGAYAKVPGAVDEPPPVYTRGRSPRPASPVLQGYENGR